MIETLVRSNRSTRRFRRDEPVARETLEWLVGLARLSASAGNLQPLKYILSWEPEKNALIFTCLAWAAYLTDWPGPAEDERPAAYILILGDKEISAHFGCDHGIAAQSILLGAREKGLGGCMIGSINRELLRQNLHIPDRFDLLLAIALGQPGEEVVLTDIAPQESIKYWRDEEGRHWVPKRRLEDIIIS